MEAKPRPIRLEAHVLAYLGDFMNIFDESIRRSVLKEINTPSLTKPAAPTTPPTLVTNSSLASNALANSQKPLAQPRASR